MIPNSLLVHFYAILSAISSALILLQLSLLAIGIRTYSEPLCGGSPLGKKAAIVPVYNEDLVRFREVINSLVSTFDRVIVVGDGVDEPYRSISKGLGAEFYYIPKGGKRRALEVGISKLEDEEFVALVDSDTVVPMETVRKAIAVLSCGYEAVTVRVRVERKSALGRLAEMYETYKDLVARAFAGFGKVLVLNGQFSVYKAEALKRIAVGLSERRVLGKPVILGDDKELTSRFYRLGYRAAYLTSAYVITSSPESSSHFIKQIIRWSRASYLYFFLDLAEANISRGAYYFVSGTFSVVLPIVALALSLTSLGLPKRLVIHISAPELVLLVRALKWNFTHGFYYPYYSLSTHASHVTHLFVSHYERLAHFFFHYIDPILFTTTVLVFFTKLFLVIPGYEIAKAIGKEVKKDLAASMMALMIFMAQTYISLYALLTVFNFTHWLTRDVKRT